MPAGLPSGISGVPDEALTDPEILQVNAEDAATELGTSSIGATALPFGLTGTQTPASKVRLTTLLSRGLSRPSSLAFKPGEGSLWISNRGDDSTVIVDNVGTASQKAQRFADDSDHFMNNPTQLAFSALLPEFAVSLESDNDYNGQAAPNYFTGVTLFTSDRRYFSGGAMSHLDMLHHSPYSVGVSVGARPTSSRQDMREYWVFNGKAGSIDRYFFRSPHELGADDHSDGITVRYAAGQLRRKEQVPSHLAFDAATKQLYIADTGNRRIVRLDTRVALDGARRIAAYHNETPLYGLAGSQVTEVANAGLEMPAGLVLYKGFLVVSDHGNGQIKLFTTDGTPSAAVDTGLGAGALTGLAVSPGGKLLALDAKQNRVLLIEFTQ